MAISPGGTPLNVADGLREFARSTPNVVAIIDGDRRFTFAAIHERSSRLANALLSAGVRPGDRAGVLMHNRAEYMETTAALAKSGIILVPINPRATPTEIGHILVHADIRVVLVEAELRAALDGVEGLPPLVISVGAGPDAGANPRANPHANPNPDAGAGGERDYEATIAGASCTDPMIAFPETHPFTVVYTSGTTGRPKGVVLSHRARALTFYASALEWGFGFGATSVAVAPMYHGAGLAYSYGALFTGGSITIMPKWDPEHFLHVVARDRATVSFMVPTHAHMLRALEGDALAKADTSSLRTLFFNAAALPVVLKRWVMESLPAVGIHELYGSTEAGVVANLRPPDAARKAGSVGPPWLMTQTRLLGRDGQPVEPGEPGELYSRAPWLMTGYLHDDPATQACTTEDGFLTAGDVAVQDEEGYLSIVDRTKDMIVTGGVNVYPREIEELIAADPGVAEVAVVGLPDSKWGESITAFVVARPGHELEFDTLTSALRDRLAPYKIPRDWRQVEALPRSTAGKILKREIQAGYPHGLDSGGVA